MDVVLEDQQQLENEPLRYISPDEQSTSTQGSISVACPFLPDGNHQLDGGDEDDGISRPEITSDDQDEIKLLFSMKHSPAFDDNSCSLIPTTTLTNEDSQLQKQRRHHTELTTISAYRNYMEVATAITFQLMEAVQLLEMASNHVTRTIPITDYLLPVTAWEAWIWVVEECVTLTLKNAPPKRKPELKSLAQDCIEKFAKNCKLLKDDVLKVQKTLAKLQHEFVRVEKASRAKFRANLIGAETEYECTEKAKLIMDLKRRAERGHPHKHFEHHHLIKSTKGRNKVMELRWDLNGVTFRVKSETEQAWVKLNSVKSLQDKKILIQHFVRGANDFVPRVGRIAQHFVNMLSSAERSSSNNNNVPASGRESILAEMKEQRELLSTRMAPFYPSEEVQMHCSTLVNGDLLNRLYDIVAHLEDSVGGYADTVMALRARRRDVAKGFGRRMPLDNYRRNVGKGGAATYESHDGGSGESRENSVHFLSIPNTNFGDIPTPSTTTTTEQIPLHERLNFGDAAPQDFDLPAEWSRSVQQTCFLFRDTRRECKRVEYVLSKGVNLDPKYIALCGDGIKTMSDAVRKLEQWVEIAKKFVYETMDCITSQDRAAPPSHGNQLAHFIHLTLQTIERWHCNTLSYLRKFTFANEKLLEKTTELDKTFRTIMAVFSKIKNDLKTLDEAIKLHPQVVKFRQTIPFKVVPQPDASTPCDEDEPADPQTRNDVFIKFIDSDVEFTVREKTNDDGKVRPWSTFFLRDVSKAYQADIVCTPIYQQIRIINKAICNIQAVQRVLESFQICELWEIIVPPVTIREIPPMPDYNRLESIVLAVLINTASTSVYSISPSLIDLDNHIGQLSSLVHVLQIHAKAKQLVDHIATTGAKTTTTKRKVKIDLEEKEQFRQVQTYVDNLPTEFEIWDGPLAHEYAKTIKSSLKSQERLEQFRKQTANPSKEIETTTSEAKL
ncbi:DEP domain-containing protein 7 [Folsomia candida]|uniref:DEP domain-containing protein 7 n=1 Tax=Folsomia candida TaxID=158441 RepID=A0A226DZS7_FOLCA|nr:DEP domain-containing protein 7 [Folsomia candida]